MPSVVLAIDATSPVSSAALAADGVLLASASSPARSGRDLLELVDKAVRGAARTFEAVDGILAVRGPGSFTGVRVTLATALGLAPAGSAGRPQLRTISSLAAAALQAPATSRTVLVVADALRGELFRQEFARLSAGLGATAEAVRCAASTLDPASADAWVAIGSAPAGVPGALWIEAAPLAPRLAVEGSRGALEALLSTDVVPLYLRSPAVSGTAAARR